MKVNELKLAPKIYVAGYVGAWNVIDDYDGYVLLEHNTFGDDCVYLVAESGCCRLKQYRNPVTHDKVLRPYFDDHAEVYETYDDIVTCLEDAGVI